MVVTILCPAPRVAWSGWDEQTRTRVSVTRSPPGLGLKKGGAFWEDAEPSGHCALVQRREPTCPVTGPWDTRLGSCLAPDWLHPWARSPRLYSRSVPQCCSSVLWGRLRVLASTGIFSSVCGYPRERLAGVPGPSWRCTEPAAGAGKGGCLSTTAPAWP